MTGLPEWIDREERQPASYPSIVVLADGTRLPATIANVSSEGCQLECSALLPIGQIVRVETAGGNSAQASVRWAYPGRAGLRFVPFG